MKFFSKKYDRTVVVEFYSDKTRKDDAIKENAKNLLSIHFKEENRLIYSSRLESYPDLSQLTSQSRLYLVGHGEKKKQKFSSCDVDMLVERLVDDCSLKAAKRITLIACHLGEMKEFIADLQLKLAEEGVYTEVAAYKSYLVVDHLGHRWVDLGEENGLVEAGKQKIVMGWHQGPEGTFPQQVVLVDTNEINPYYEDALDAGDDKDESAFFETAYDSQSNQEVIFTPESLPFPIGSEHSYSNTKLKMFSSSMDSETQDGDNASYQKRSYTPNFE
ncbi:Peptidase C80 family [Legionella steigerwaltii]|uniref:Peptidase C80 family n=1 Tax=Legionella steigerwaltii TaxID=460 RepID=A0A378LD12_9GAMM|nr:C80 family cysteine peptidase [Legionella steigerwaltii]KTD79057.1 Peptidase C80 family protein [Legionella steigerwaltii]STY23649.1 Peptidase C80 family [Legionella steigerwaltii]